MIYLVQGFTEIGNFHGHISSGGPKGAYGLVKDCFGDSYLDEIVVTPDSLRFVQYYREDPTRFFTYHKAGNVWVGSYTVEGYEGDAETKCAFTEVPDDFFEQQHPIVKPDTSFCQISVDVRTLELPHYMGPKECGWWDK